MSGRNRPPATTNGGRKHFVLDSFAMLSFLFGEKGGSEVMDILNSARAGKTEVLMHWNNVAEVYYIIRKQESRQRALQIVAMIKILPIILVEFDETLWLKAAELKGTRPISFADAFVAATAEMNDAVVVTGDPEFEHLRDVISIRWIGKK